MVRGLGPVQFLGGLHADPAHNAHLQLTRRWTLPASGSCHMRGDNADTARHFKSMWRGSGGPALYGKTLACVSSNVFLLAVATLLRPSWLWRATVTRTSSELSAEYQSQTGQFRARDFRRRAAAHLPTAFHPPYQPLWFRCTSVRK